MLVYFYEVNWIIYVIFQIKKLSKIRLDTFNPICYLSIITIFASVYYLKVQFIFSRFL